MSVFTNDERLVLERLRERLVLESALDHTKRELVRQLDEVLLNLRN